MSLLLLLLLVLSLLLLLLLVVAFFLACENFGKMFDQPFPAYAFLSFFFFFFKVEISSRPLIPLFLPGSVHSDSAS